MKKLLALLITCSMLFAVGCGSNESPLADYVGGGGSGTPGEITLVNDSGYTFVELYSTASTSTSFGAELLGGMRIESGMQVSMTIGDISLPQDFLIVDADGDSYNIQGMQLSDSNVITILLTSDGSDFYPIADVYDASGALVQSYSGIFVPDENANATGYDTNGSYGFTVNNNSGYEIYSIHVGIMNASSIHDIDLLPQTLPAESSTDVTGFATQGDWMNTEWTLYITDVDGDTSASYDAFNPWSLSAVDVTWDSNAGGYVCTFIY